MAVGLLAVVAAAGLTLRVAVPPHAAASASREPAAATADSLSPAETDALHSSLQKRAEAVEGGAGKRYRVDALVGFLNVHSEPGDPFRTDNVCAQLAHNAVVESIVERGVWVQHDGGGWSIRVYDGHHFLVPLD